MRGLHVNRGGMLNSELGFCHDGLKLLAKRGNLEIMQQDILKGAIAWLVPGGAETDIEFFFILSGFIELVSDGKEDSFGPGDSFYVNQLEGELFFHALEETRLLYVSTVPVFEDAAGFQMDLAHMVSQINKKDDYTYRHSRNVMGYAVKLFTNLRAYCEIDKKDDIVIAALFHDIGKCKTPDDILKKMTSLDLDEYEIMKQHAACGAELLSNYYPKSITDLVYNHHERLDGSGYPRGLMGDEISFGARILAVADSFDAITTNRGYNDVRDFRAAAEELAAMKDRYDERITSVLLKLVDEGEIAADQKSG